MKVFAVGSFVKPLTDEQRKQIMSKEVPDTLKLYLDGKIDQFWFREDQPGVVFLLNAASVEEARSIPALPSTWPGSTRPAMGRNREETCHLLAADFPHHSCYTRRC